MALQELLLIKKKGRNLTKFWIFCVRSSSECLGVLLFLIADFIKTLCMEFEISFRCLNLLFGYSITSIMDFCLKYEISLEFHADSRFSSRNERSSFSCLNYSTWT